MEPESERAKLAAEFPSWRVWRNGGLVMAWLPGTDPPLRLYAATVDGLRGQLTEHEAKEGDQHERGPGT